MGNEYDLVIKGGNVICFDKDGILQDTNIGICEGVIKKITKKPISGTVEIDASNKYVSPGFIDFHSHINGRKFSAECMLRQGATTTIGGERIFASSIIRVIETDGFLINHGFYISYSFTLRRAVGIQDPSQKASKTEIDNMIKLAERFFEFGVLGIHFSLEYAPGTEEEELVEILKSAKKYKKVAMIHLRRDGYRAAESLEEIIRVAKATGAAIHILHTMYTAGYDKLLDHFLMRIDEARAEGCDITADTGVYAAYPTFVGSLIFREGWEKGYQEGTSESNLLVSSGIHIGEFCSKELFEYIRKNFPTTLITAFVYDQGQIPKALSPKYMMVSTNGAYGPHMKNIGHPEGAGTFPKLISQYVREQHILSLTDAIKKITYMPAQRFQLANKGNIKPEMDADITIFDLDKIEAKASYVNFSDPNSPPEGIEYVIIGGHLILENGKIKAGSENHGKLIKA